MMHAYTPHGRAQTCHCHGRTIRRWTAEHWLTRAFYALVAATIAVGAGMASR